jgi:hypothetical protein
MLVSPTRERGFALHPSLARRRSRFILLVPLSDQEAIAQALVVAFGVTVLQENGPTATMPQASSIWAIAMGQNILLYAE